ncbi:MAG TPA: GAF domain-containing protein [bacterium]
MFAHEWSKSFAEIAEALLENKTLDSVLDTITRTSCSFFNASASSIMLFDSNREYLTIARSFNLSPEYLKAVRVRKDEEIAGVVCQKKKFRFVPNVMSIFENIGNHFTVDWIEKEGLVSLVCAPLILKSEAIGCLNIYYRTPQEKFQDEESLDFFTKLSALAIEHIKLLGETEEKSQIVTGLEEIGILLTSSFEVEKIVEVFLSTAVAITRVDSGTLILVDEMSKKITDAFEYANGKFTHQQYVSPTRLSEGMSGELIRTRRPVIMNDIKEHDIANPVSIMKQRASIAGFPLIAREKLIGILYVESTQRHEFSRNEVDYLSMLCSQAAIALDNTSLYRRISREAMDMAILYEVGQSFISTLDFDQLLNNILRRLVNLFGYLNLAVFLVDEENQELKLRSYINYPEAVKNMKIKIGEVGVTGHVAATRQMHYAPDVTKEPHYVVGVKEAKSEVCLPLMIGERLVGVLDVESPVFDGFTQDDINLLSTLSAQIAIALENSRLYEEARRLSLTDPLTTLPNRRNFEVLIDAEIKRAERYRRPFAVLMIDFDNFKSYNDAYGHLAGDKILIKLSQIMKESIRDVDFLCRYGGDEFVAILPETEATFALEAADRMRGKILAQDIDPPVTLSIGISTFPLDGKDSVMLIHLADQACYEAKQMGGNRVNFAHREKQ